MEESKSPSRVKPYHLAGERSKRNLRADLCTAIENLVRDMTPEGTDLEILFADLTECRKWKALCGKEPFTPVNAQEDSFLIKLASEYQHCKDKEQTKQAQAQAKKLTKKIKIGGTMKDSRISLDGSKSLGSTRVEAAKSVGRVRAYGDEKRRLLSIVANDYPYRVLKQYFKCSDKTIVAAKVHFILFGRGGIPIENFKFTR